YPQEVASQIGEVNIKQPPLNYSASSSGQEENDLVTVYTQRANEIFGGSQNSSGWVFDWFSWLNWFLFHCLLMQDYRLKSVAFLQEKENCPTCSSLLTMEGHNLPFETFFGWEGEKTPDIDLNFSGEYQKIAHNYVRQLLGEKSVYRIGTINTLSQQTAEIFYREHLKLRKKLNSGFNEEKWFREWIDGEKLPVLEKKLAQTRQEKAQLEAELKKIESQK
ncbi:21718_t:CDS:2, partial [Racocetra persica]